MAYLLLPLLALTTATPLATRSCPAYTLLDARGTGEPQGTSIGFAPMIKRILAAVPNGAVHDVVYPAAPDITQLTTMYGAKDAEQYINSALAACPDEKFALMGYSQGATVVNEVLQYFAPGSTQGTAIVGVVEIGNPYHQPGRRGNVDENGGSSTAGATGSLNMYANYTIPDAWYATGKVLDICYTNDPVCNGISAATLFSPSHFYYGFSDSVQDEGARFLIPRV